MCPGRCAARCDTHTPQRSLNPIAIFVYSQSDLERPVDELIQHYRNRWQIETTFRDVKQNFGFDTYQLRKRKSLNRFCSTQFLSQPVSHNSFSQNTATNTASENKYRRCVS